ncbi:hypothetical protein SEA_SPILLED_216 [Streptomyces phage Spilled]|nr:hypothetical protein SEA_BIRCHLYN_208 [Streptomyces phage Birchlyn]QFP97485.1 hypothetical protein SEA_ICHABODCRANE_204 [Streptomyces phage IchabodCrane]QGH79061.1 hypothetical protein SEA_TOMSAWYER_213 [Streptomyces phage TomSawyer]QPL13805.1 hypothetical protein SEA_MINDFLAYER_202 [Streptomyces phage MindFlayer]URM87698.1 hypothetical protein SEA_QUARAN19_209 [Streptomyces phage Quaran19]UVK60070.1 hypothetical protein SEA_SPILLED_216 [Streptomyces phage Spilled]UVK61023.1 hypothetical p
MFPNPEKFANIVAWRASMTEWRVIGVMYNGQETIKSGFKSEALAQAWLNVYLERYVKEHMFPHDLDGFEFEYLDSTN